MIIEYILSFSFALCITSFTLYILSNKTEKDGVWVHKSGSTRQAPFKNRPTNTTPRSKGNV